MPNKDRTGPLGSGALSGRGLGPCGQGMRRGSGRGFGRGMGARCIQPANISLEAELKQIESEKEAVEKKLAQMA